MSFKLNSLTDM